MEAQQSSEAVARALDAAAALMGGRAELGRLLSPAVRPSAIGNWKARGIPIEYCPQIERLTGGRITRRDFRPADYGDIWPELAQADAIEAGAVPVAQVRELLARDVVAPQQDMPFAGRGDAVQGVVGG